MAVPYSFFEVYLAVHPKDLPSGRPQVRDRHLKFHEDRDNLATEKRSGYKYGQEVDGVA